MLNLIDTANNSAMGLIILDSLKELRSSFKQQVPN